MDYTKAKEYLSSATYIYVNLTEEEFNSVLGPKYRSKIDGIELFGTSIEIPEAGIKQLKPGLTSFA